MTFMARYSSPCEADCGHRIQPGDMIRGAGDSHTDGYAHVVCPAPELQVERTPCSRCFQVPATNGSCGCEDPS